jgi:hypothetical protein
MRVKISLEPLHKGYTILILVILFLDILYAYTYIFIRAI